MSNEPNADLSPTLIRSSNGDVQMHFTTEDLIRWEQLDLIPAHLVNGQLNSIAKASERGERIKEFKEKFPNASFEEMAKEVFGIPKILTQEESEQFHTEMNQSIELHKLLLDKWVHLEKAYVPEILDPLFKNVDSTTEFGITRFIADQMNHLPGLLENAKVEQTGTNEYEIRASKDLGKDGVKKLIFSHPITAQSDESANEIAEEIKLKLLGIRHKMWHACWLYANEIRKTQFTASVNDLMKSCYPNREAKFSAQEKEDFYEELRLLRLPEFTLTGVAEGKKGKPTEYKYNIPLLRVGGAIGEPGKTGGPPDKIFIDLCAITPIPPKSEKMRFVGVPIKKRILELNAQDCTLAFFLQLRKNQITEGDPEKEKTTPHYDFSIDQLIEVAVLQPTFNSNPTMGRKRLTDKLTRSKEKGIIKNFKQIQDKFRIWW